MDKNTKIILSAVVAIVVIGGLVWVIASNQSDGEADRTNTSSDYLKSIQPITTSTTSITSTSFTGSYNNLNKNDLDDNYVKSASPLYVEMVKKFVGTRFQFSKNCTLVTPTDFVLKKGAKFMIDNRDDKSHTFSFSGQRYYVSAYGFGIISTPKIGKQSVYCDGVQRAMVNVER